MLNSSPRSAMILSLRNPVNFDLMEFAENKKNNCAIFMIPLGVTIPEGISHGVSVSLPTWASNIGYEEGEPFVVKAMQGGYPRFVFHRYIKQLASYCLDRFANSSEACLLLNSNATCCECREYLHRTSVGSSARVSELYIQNEDQCCVVYMIFFPVIFEDIAKQFWQHTGTGISSRYAEHCLRSLGLIIFAQKPDRRYKVTSKYQSASIEPEQKEFEVHLEERFGRNLDKKMTDYAIRVIKRRIAGTLGDTPNDLSLESLSLDKSPGAEEIDERHVYLFPSGMSAIYFAHKMTIDLRKNLKSVQFGFPYIDTLKMQQRFGSGCYFFGNGDIRDLKSLELLLLTEKISSVFCEFPSNPLLKSPDLEYLWNLAKKHGFFLIVDETGKFIVN